MSPPTTRQQPFLSILSQPPKLGKNHGLRQRKVPEAASFSGWKKLEPWRVGRAMVKVLPQQTTNSSLGFGADVFRVWAPSGRSSQVGG